ncbi:MAG TPA: hypothetical protein VHZ96_21360 [Frankiaceae bacterium]|jgi:hypothetical protein|nr:hypothetical protein [Frankiaceae bacterium]
MEHVVFSAAENGAGEEFRRVATLEEAVRVVEHLRNDLGITDPSVFALTPVPVAFRTYYRVEVPSAPEPVAEPVSEAVPEPAPEVAEAAPVAPESSLELAPAELPHLDEDLESGEDATADGDFLFDGHSDMEVAGLMPEASAIPASRSDAEAEHSLGYFAR